MASVVSGGRIGPQFMNRDIFQRSFRLETRARLSASQVYDTLTGLVKAEDIISIGRSHSTSWNVCVASDEAAVIILRAGVLQVAGRDCRLISISNQLVEVRCHWLPEFINNDFLKFYFSSFGSVDKITREVTVISHGVEAASTVRVVHLRTDDLQRGSIPHLVRFDGGIQMLITLPGRPPLCLRCYGVGHMRRDCQGGPSRPTPERRTYAAVAEKRDVPQHLPQHLPQEQPRDEEQQPEAPEKEVVEGAVSSPAEPAANDDQEKSDGCDEDSLSGGELIMDMGTLSGSDDDMGFKTVGGPTRKKKKVK